MEPEMICMLEPHVFSEATSTWIPQKSSSISPLERGTLIKLVSWNIDKRSTDPEARARAAIAHLKSRFEGDAARLVVMLQEVSGLSLDVILQDAWARKKFALSDVEPPDIGWRVTKYSTLMMISRDLPVTNCFRVPFEESGMGRDILAADISVASEDGASALDVIRLCTVHLESLYRGRGFRMSQLAAMSAVLKGKPAFGSRVIAGISGGDMNAMGKEEDEWHRADSIGLKDVFLDAPGPHETVPRRSGMDFSYGRARGSTFGFQSKHKGSKRLDKFFYTGPIETVALEKESQDVSGSLGRVGIGVKTTVESKEEVLDMSQYSSDELPLRCQSYWSRRKFKKYLGHELPKGHKDYPSRREFKVMKGKGFKPKIVCTNLDAWASDHFGITVGVKLR